MPTSPETPTATAAGFESLGLPENLLRVLRDVGYESPSPIQAATIPPLLAGRDMVGQAQTGTGKTAAFALPILAKLKMDRTLPQALVLAPTRELAIQVAEAFQRYAAHMPGFHVLPIYGGQSYGPQLAGLRRGVHVVVGTPGRVIDHLEKNTLDLSQLSCLVLDEADEMLRMGFIDDVETVLKKTPATRQVALFSATMPAPIRRIAEKYLKSPAEVTIKSKTTTATNIRQRFWLVSGLHKLDALTRILEAETFEAMLVFARTKKATEELAERLQARGFSAAAINGDIEQKQRERTIARLKDGQIDILVATDVAARGLDVERISHVVNYDIPYDTEAYVHRIGRTGRAGRNGDAILFVTPRERGMLSAIERATRQPITPMTLPSIEDVNSKRINKFMEKISETRAAGGLEPYQKLIEQYERDHNIPALEIAAALAKISQGKTPLLMEPAPREARVFDSSSKGPPRDYDRSAPRPARADRVHSSFAKREGFPPDRGTPDRGTPDRGERAERAPRSDYPTRPRPPVVERAGDAERSGFAQRGESEEFAEKPRAKKPRGAPEPGMETFRVEVGHNHQVKPGNIVGAIANEAGLESKHIGRIDIHDQHSLVDLPEGMPPDVLGHLKNVWVAGQRLRITRASEAPDLSETKPSDKPREKSFAKKPGEFARKPGGFDKKPGGFKKAKLK